MPRNCCYFLSPSPDNPIPHATAWWDGYKTNIWGHEYIAPSGMYGYTLTLYGCGGETIILHDTFYLGSFYGKSSSINDSTNLPIKTGDSLINGTLQSFIDKKEELENEIKLSPNPATSKINILGVAANDISNVKIYDDKGIIVKYEKEVRNDQINVESLKPGTYYCKIKVSGLTVTKKFVKL